MKKYLLILIIFATYQVSSQVLPLPIMEENNIKSAISKITFDELSKSGETYFKNIDVDRKGSGYKPFKRWEYHWSHYLQPDGTIAPAEHLWKAWGQKQKMSNSSKAASNWTNQGPFDQSSKSGQGRINTVFVDPNDDTTIYVGAPAGGLWKSNDTGVNWTPLTDDLPQIGVSGIAIHPSDSNTIYISTGDDDGGDSYSIGVLKSTDGGATFNTTGSLGLGSGTPTSNEIVIDPSDPNKVWVATGAGLYLSTNGGNSWDLKQSGSIIDFKLKTSDPNTIYAVSNNTFYRSTNGGTSFTSTSTGLPATNLLGRLRVEVTPASGASANVYVLAAGPGSNYNFVGVYVSSDSGATFNKTIENNDIFNSTQAWFDLAFAVSDTNINIIHVGVLDIWRSINGGNNFSKLNDWTTVNTRFTHADIHFLRYFNGVLYAGTDGGVYRSTNNGLSFTDLTQNLSISQFYKVSVSKQSSNKMAGGLQDNGGFSLSNNTWNNYHGGDGMDAASDPNDEDTFYGFTQFGGNLSVTTDGGLTSSTIAGSPTQGNWVTPLVINKAGDIYAGYDELYQLIDNNWSSTTSHSFGGNLEAIEIDPSNNNNIYVSRGITLFKSTDKGITFTSLSAGSTGIKGVNISSIEVHNADSSIIWVTTSGVSFSSPSSGYTGGGVYKSTDGGLTFTNIGIGLPNESKFVVRHHPFTTNNSIYVGTALGVYHINDDTNVWEVFSTNLPNVAVSDLEINPYDHTITAATYGRSIWQSTIPTVVQPDNDIDLVKTSPSSINILGGCSGDLTPSINVINNGLITATSFTVNYNIDNGANQSFNWTGSIASNATQTINLPTMPTPSFGEHTINTEIVFANDANSSNNTSEGKFTVLENTAGDGQITYTFGDSNPSASENAGTWIVSDDNLWEIGTPTTTLLNNIVASGYVTNPSGNTPDQMISTLTSPCYNLAFLQDPILKFKMAFVLEPNYDIMYVEYSTDQGANWEILGTANNANWYNSNRTNASSGSANDCQNCPGAQWTGTDATLKNYQYNLSALNNETSIIFRFKFVADPNTNDEGVVIDDFVIDASAILSVNDFEEGEFLIYPNPSRDIFNIKRATTIGENMKVEVYDVTGKVIRSKSNILDGDYELNMSNVAKGLYFLQVSIGNKRLVKKLMLN